jgi:ubiquinone biosynthesis protein COQ9
MLFDSPETKHKILTEFLKICPFDGWNNGALLKAMEACGIGENFLTLIFENGCVDLAEFYVESQNQKSAEILENLSEKKIRDKIRLSLYARFEVEKNNKIALQRLINFYLDPKNFTSFEIGARPMIQGLKLSFKIADFIWKNIGDESTDFNFYTKRLTLGKIIFRSLLTFLKDESLDFEKTKKLIDSEIEKVMKFEKRKAQLKKFSTTAKKTCEEFFLDEKGQPKSPKDFLKNLPFFRLIKK